MLMRCTNVESKLFSTNRYLGPALFNGACKAFAYSSSNNIRTSIPWKGLLDPTARHWHWRIVPAQGACMME